MTGNEAIAEAAIQAGCRHFFGYPITPQSPIPEYMSRRLPEIGGVYLQAESEVAAINMLFGAAGAGARVMTATASQGLALMNEVLFVTAGLRLPMVICEINRTLSAPINIHCDHSDTMDQRDTGWMQFYAEDSQEAYDLVIQAIKIAEEAFLPAMVSADAFILSHSLQRIEMFDDKDVQSFIGEHKTPYTLLDTEHPITVGPLDLQDYYFEHNSFIFH